MHTTSLTAVCCRCGIEHRRCVCVRSVRSVLVTSEKQFYIKILSPKVNPSPEKSLYKTTFCHFGRPLKVPEPDREQRILTSGASTNVCMNFLIGWPLLDSSPSTCTTTPSLMVACASTCRIFVWHSLNCSDITFLWISW